MEDLTRQLERCKLREVFIAEEEVAMYKRAIEIISAQPDDIITLKRDTLFNLLYGAHYRCTCKLEELNLKYPQHTIMSAGIT